MLVDVNDVRRLEVQPGQAGAVGVGAGDAAGGAAELLQEPVVGLGIFELAGGAADDEDFGVVGRATTELGPRGDPIAARGKRRPLGAGGALFVGAYGTRGAGGAAVALASSGVPMRAMDNVTSVLGAGW